MLSERKLIAAIVKGGHKRGESDAGKPLVKLLSDDPSAEPVETVAKALADMGMQPESVDVFRKGTTPELVAKTRERVAKSRELHKSRRLEAFATLRALAGDDIAVEIAAGRAYPWAGHKVQAVLKVRHDGRQHPETGKFVPMRPGEAKQVRVPGVALPITMQDTRRGSAWATDGGKGVPGNSPQEGLNAYGEPADKPDEDPEGLAARFERILYGKPAPTPPPQVPAFTSDDRG